MLSLLLTNRIILSLLTNRKSVANISTQRQSSPGRISKFTYYFFCAEEIAFLFVTLAGCPRLQEKVEDLKLGSLRLWNIFPQISATPC